MDIWLYKHVYKCIYTYIHTCMYVCTNIIIHMHMCIHICIIKACINHFAFSFLAPNFHVSAMFDIYFRHSKRNDGGTGWRKCIECLKLQIPFRKRATNFWGLLREMTCKDKASYASLPLFIVISVCIVPESLASLLDKRDTPREKTDLNKRCKTLQIPFHKRATNCRALSHFCMC